MNIPQQTRKQCLGWFYSSLSFLTSKQKIYVHNTKIP